MVDLAGLCLWVRPPGPAPLCESAQGRMCYVCWGIRRPRGEGWTEEGKRGWRGRFDRRSSIKAAVKCVASCGGGDTVTERHCFTMFSGQEENLTNFCGEKVN